MRDDSEVVARLEGVSHRYGAISALEDVNLALRRGEVLALLGPNGAGKSTALGLLTGLLRVQQGRVSLAGGDPRALASRRQLGAMLQEARLPDTLRVGELIRQFRAYYPNPRSVAETLALAGLDGLAERFYGELSGGQQRRVQFALAIVGRPKVVLVDEPTVGLDVEARRAFWAVLRALRLEGVALVLTTHYLDEADALADRVVVLRAGRVVAEGSPMQLRSQRGGTRIRCRSARAEEEVRAWPGVRSVHRDGTHLHLVCDDPVTLLRGWLQRDETLGELEVRPASLEDTFLDLTGAAAPQETAA